MDSTSQSQSSAELSECASCKRVLPLRCYGILRSELSGYNPVCKDCRNYRRRRSYGSAVNEGPIYPLNENNRKAIDAMIQGSLKTIPALSLRDDQDLSFSIDTSGDYPTFSLLKADGTLISKYRCCNQPISEFTEVAVTVLKDSKIRLNF